MSSFAVKKKPIPGLVLNSMLNSQQFGKSNRGGKSSFHGGSHPQGRVYANHVVVGEMQSDGSFEVFELIKTLPRSRLTVPHRGKARLDLFQMAKAICKHLSKDRGNFVPYCGGIKDMGRI